MILSLLGNLSQSFHEKIKPFINITNSEFNDIIYVYIVVWQDVDACFCLKHIIFAKP